MSHNEQKNKHKISNTNLRSLCHHQNHQLRTGLEMKLPFLPPRHATRFWFQNCNGLITANDNLKFQHEIQTYVEKGIHFISLAETRLNISHTLTNYQIEQSMQQLIPTSKAILHNTPGYSSTSAYQPGGVATFLWTAAVTLRHLNTRSTWSMDCSGVQRHKTYPPSLYSL